MKNKLLLPVILLFLLVCNISAEENNLNIDSLYKYEIYGFVRNDFTFDSRKSIAAVGELFYFIPYDRQFSANGNDLNAVYSTRLLAVTTRFGFNFTSPVYSNNFQISAKIETDFCGAANYITLFRIRQAFVSLNWKHHNIITGQTWHPMTGELIPSIVSLNTGAPFNPFSRAPQLRYNALINNFTISAAAIYQLQYPSPGPEGNSTNYQIFKGLPEFYFGLSYKNKFVKIGAGIEYLNISPRKNYTDESGNIFTVTDRASSYCTQLFLQLTNKGFDFKAKSVYGGNMGHLLMMSGYGASNLLPDAVSYEYSPIYQSSTWATLSYTYAKNKHAITSTILGGYIKNLGASKNLIPEKVYFRGNANFDDIFRIAPSVTYQYNNNLNVGLEYEYTGVHYGELNPDYTVFNTHLVGNNRLYVILVYKFNHLFTSKKK